MADRSIFWKMVDRTKPSKLRVFAESELRDCQDYFLEIQSDSTLPSNEIITASERLTLIRSEINLRHGDAKHGQTQRLARWAIGVGIVSIALAIISGVAQRLANKPTQKSWPAAIETPAVATPTVPTATPQLSPAPTARRLRDYVSAFVLAGLDPHVPAEVNFFADRVQYYDQGVINREKVREDLQRYAARWPERRFWLAGDITVEPQNGNRVRVTFPLRYELRKGAKHSSGKVDKILVLEPAGDDLQIVAVSERKAE